MSFRRGRLGFSNMKGFPFNDFCLEDLDLATINFSRRVAQNGGIISNDNLSAINKFVLACKRTLLWSKLLDVGVFAGSNLAAALTKLKHVNGASPFLTNINFVNSDYNRATGLRGNGIDKYLKTGFIPAIHLLSSLDCHASVLARTVPGLNSSNPTYLGCIQSSRFFVRKTSSSNRIDAFLGNSTENNTHMSLTAGLITATNTNANTGSIYLSGDSQYSDTNFATESRPPQDVYLFALNSSGSPGNYSDIELSYYSCGLGLNAVDVNNLSIAVRNLQIGLSRQK